MSFAVSRQDIEQAQKRLGGEVVRTPLLRFPVLDERVGARVLVKLENLQQTGSFKFRGAFNRLSMIPEDLRAAGVVACSSGNHAQGVALAARKLGMKATIVMPEDAPAIKLKRTKEFGGTVVTYNRETEDRDAIAQGICAETGATFVHPFNDPGVIAGQGTLGVELVQQAKDLGVEDLEEVWLGASGGGLASGVALSLSSDLPSCRLRPVEPQGFDDLSRSLEAGVREKNTRLGGSVCDALLAPTPGELTFQILKELALPGYSVSDEEALAAVAFAFQDLKVAVEPGGAVSLAALLSGRYDVRGKTIAIVLTGGNLDLATLQKALEQECPVREPIGAL